RLGAGGRLGDHPEVVLQGEQGGQRAADQVLVVGEQHPYGLGHEAASPTGPSVASGTSAVSRNRSPPTRPASSRPSTAASRSRSPASPEPPESGARTVPSAPPAGGSPPSPPPAPLPRPAPSFSTVSTTRPSTVRTVTAHQVASPCRSTFVVASRTTQPSADCTRGGSPAGRPVTSQSMPAAASTPRAPASSASRSASR